MSLIGRAALRRFRIARAQSVRLRFGLAPQIITYLKNCQRRLVPHPLRRGIRVQRHSAMYVPVHIRGREREGGEELHTEGSSVYLSGSESETERKGEL